MKEAKKMLAHRKQKKFAYNSGMCNILGADVEKLANEMLQMTSM